MKNLLIFLKGLINSFKNYNQYQNRIDILINNKDKKTEYINVKIPKKYLKMIEILAVYGIKDELELKRIFESHIKNHKK